MSPKSDPAVTCQGKYHTSSQSQAETLPKNDKKLEDPPKIRSNYRDRSITLWSYDEAADFLGVSVSHLYRLCSAVKGTPLDFKERNRGRYKLSRAKFEGFINYHQK